MYLELYWDPSCKVLNFPENEGFSEVSSLLEKMKRKAVEIKAINTQGLSKEELQEAYIKAIAPSVFKRYEVKSVFGTKKTGGCFFGREVPALVVCGEKGKPQDVYPHKKEGRIVTIKAFLEGILAHDE